MVPLAWGMVAALHTNETIFKIPFDWFPVPMHWENYSKAWEVASFGKAMWLSFFIAFVITVFCVLFSHMAGYGLTKFKFFGRNLIFTSIISTLLVPFTAIMLPVFIFTRSLGWVNTLPGVIVPGLVTAQAVFFMRQYMTSFPAELISSARIDGASEWKIYWSIVLPITGPVCAAVAALTFVGSWNNLLWPLIVIQDKSLYTIPLALTSFNTVNFTNYVQMMAMSMIAIFPVVILFFLISRKLIDSLMVNGGGIKG